MGVKSDSDLVMIVVLLVKKVMMTMMIVMYTWHRAINDDGNDEDGVDDNCKVMGVQSDSWQMFGKHKYFSQFALEHYQSDDDDDELRILFVRWKNIFVVARNKMSHLDCFKRSTWLLKSKKNRSLWALRTRPRL